MQGLLHEDCVPCGGRRRTFERGNFNPEEGSREGQGRRSDLEAAAAMIDSGASLLEVAQTHQSDFIRYHGDLCSTRR